MHEKTKLKEKTMKKKKRARRSVALYVARGAFVAALYIALTYIASILGISSGVIQFRLSEALCILPVFLPEAILGLFIGCIISNIVSEANVFDIIFGSLATLIGALGAYALRKLPHKLKPIATLPTLFSNAIIIPFVLMFAYGFTDGYFFLMATVGLGELVYAVIGGSALYFAIHKSKIFK